MDGYWMLKLLHMAGECLIKYRRICTVIYGKPLLGCHAIRRRRRIKWSILKCCAKKWINSVALLRKSHTKYYSGQWLNSSYYEFYCIGLGFNKALDRPYVECTSPIDWSSIDEWDSLLLPTVGWSDECLIDRNNLVYLPRNRHGRLRIIWV